MKFMDFFFEYGPGYASVVRPGVGRAPVRFFDRF